MTRIIENPSVPSVEGLVETGHGRHCRGTYNLPGVCWVLRERQAGSLRLNAYIPISVSGKLSGMGPIVELDF